MRGTSPVTATTSLSRRIVSEKSTRAVWLTLSCTSFCVSRPKSGASTRMSYAAAGSDRWYPPELDVN